MLHRGNGAENVFVVTNGSESWDLHSLRMISQRHQACFDGADDAEVRGDDYSAAIYNTLISPNSIPVNPVISTEDNTCMVVTQ